MTTPAQTAIVATEASQRARAAVANRAPSASSPPPAARGRRGAWGVLAAAQDLDRRPSRRAPRRPRRRRNDDRRDRRERGRQRDEQIPARRALVERGQQPRRRAGDGERPDREPQQRGRHRDDPGLERLQRGDPPRREAERPLDAEAGEPPLHVGVGARREHRPGGHERDQRERHQQRDDDARRLGEQHLDPLARDELQRAEAERDRARLRQRHVRPVAVVEPQQRDVRGVRGEAEPLLDLLRADVHARHARERIRDVVGRHRDPDDPQRARAAADVQPVARVEVPLLRQPALDHDLAGRVREVVALDHVVAAAAGVDGLHGALVGVVAVRAQPGVEPLVPIRGGGEVRERPDALVDQLPRLLGEAGDDVGEVGALGRALEARRQPEAHRDADADHHRRGQHPCGRQQRPRTACPQSRERELQAGSDDHPWIRP